MTDGSKLDPAALDAYKSADPDEPTFTLQGGDPLAAPMVRLWASLARVQAGIVNPQNAWLEPAALAAINNPADERAKDELLIRATSAEEVSWAMDSYRRGDRREEPETPGEKITETKAAIDLHEYRKKAAAELSNIFSDVNIMREELAKLGMDSSIDNIMREAISLLRSIYNEVQPSDARKLDDPSTW